MSAQLVVIVVVVIPAPWSFPVIYVVPIIHVVPVIPVVCLILRIPIRSRLLALLSWVIPDCFSGDHH
jgi:hypothetical protein